MFTPVPADGLGWGKMVAIWGIVALVKNSIAI
jgi:hypothetical protein